MKPPAVHTGGGLRFSRPPVSGALSCANVNTARSSTTLALVAALALALAGCSSDTSEPESTSNSGGGGTSEHRPTNSGSDDDGGGTAGSYSWGETHSDNIDTTITEPSTFTTSSSAFPDGNIDAFGVEVTLTNNTEQPFPPIMLNINAITGTEQLDNVADTAQGYDGLASQSAIQPGKTRTFKLAWAGEPTGDTRIVVASGDSSRSATWTN